KTNRHARQILRNRVQAYLATPQTRACLCRAAGIVSKVRVPPRSHRRTPLARLRPTTWLGLLLFAAVLAAPAAAAPECGHYARRGAAAVQQPEPNGLGQPPAEPAPAKPCHGPRCSQRPTQPQPPSLPAPVQPHEWACPATPPPVLTSTASRTEPDAA